MAIRYSGDVEVRMRWMPRAGLVRAYVTDGRRPYKEFFARKRAPTSKEYDRIAALAVKHAMRKGQIQPDVKDGRIRLRRIFQAPCSTM